MFTFTRFILQTVSLQRPASRMLSNSRPDCVT
jgi:hypothetical protein